MAKPKRKKTPIETIGPNALKLLAFTDLPMTEIAKIAQIGRPGFTLQNLVKWNRMYGARPKERTEKIRAMEIGMQKQGRRKKTKHFSEKEKEKLLAQHHKALLKTARKRWTAGPRKLYSGDFDLYLNDLKDYLREQLDYYNPKIKGRKGRTASPLTYMLNGANIFYFRLYRKAAKSRERNMPLDLEGFPIAETGLVEPTRKARPETARPKLQWIPVTTGALLKKIGLSLGEVAKAGFFDVRKQLLKIAGSKKAGLNQREQKIIRMRLEGKQQTEIAAKLGIKRTSVIYAEDRAVEKIRREIRIEKSLARKRA